MDNKNNNVGFDVDELQKALVIIRQIKNEFKGIDDETKKINASTSKYNQAIKNSFINMPKGADKILASSMKDLSKMAPDLGKAFMGTQLGKGLASKEAFKNITQLYGAFNKWLPVVALATTSLTAMTAAGYKANETTINLTRSLKQLGGDLGELSTDALDSSNKMAIAKNRFSELGYSVQQLFTPLSNIVSELAYYLSGFADKIAENMNGVNSSTASTGLSQFVLDELKALSSVGVNMPVHESSALVADIVAQAQQAGIDKTSASKMALRTIAEADNIARQFGKAEQVGTVAQQLASAWLKGDSSASEYGIVTNDNTLTGFLSKEKGIDAVNTQLSEGAMMAYRFELAMDSASEAGTEELQDRVKAWNEEANAIKAAQNSLLGFEQVVTLRAVDTSIPIVDYDGVVKEINDKANSEVELGIDTVGFNSQVDSIIDMLDRIPKRIDTILNMSFQPTYTSTVPVNTSQFADSALLQIGSALRQEGSSGLPRNWFTDNVNKSVTDYVNSTTSSGGFIDRTQDLWNNLVDYTRDWYGNVNPLGKLSTDWLDNTINSWLTGHYDGGISTRAHIARVSEYNSEEAIIPLNNPSAIPAFDRMAESIADRLVGAGNGGGSSNTYNLAPGGVVIADNYSVDKFVELIANKLATLNRDRGDMSYGIR